MLIGAALLLHKRPQQRYLTTPAVVGDVEQTVLATGTVEPYQLVSVGAQVSGRVVSLKVGLGDHVTKGEVIATIDPAPQQMSLSNAQAVLQQMQAQKLSQEAVVEQDAIILKRQAATLAADASSQADYDTADANLKAAKANLAATAAQIAQARVSVQTAQVNLGYTNIVAPIDGEVVAVVTKQGQTVNSVQAAPTIVMVAEMDQMTIKAQISEADVVRVRPGMPVYFTILGDPNRRYYAKLRSVASAPESVVNDNSSTTTSTSSSSSTSQAIYYDGFFDVANPDRRLRDDMTAQVNLVVGEARHVLTVPSTALSAAAPQGPGGAHPPPGAPSGPPPAGAPSGPPPGAPPMAGGRIATVQVLDKNGRATQRQVVVGLDDNNVAEIRSGLSAGEAVVLGEAPQATAGGPRRGGPPMPL